MVYLYENEAIHDEKLHKAITETPDLHAHFRNDFGRICPDNRCGFLSWDGEEYFIVPKIVPEDVEANLDIFIYMLLYAYEVELSNESLATFENRRERLFELFVRLFADRLLDELKRGVHREYRTMRENLKVLRGKYLIERNFRNFHHQNLYCEFDEFSMDNQLNRLFLYAIHTLERFSSYANLSRCETMLDEVSDVRFDPERVEISFDRLNDRFRHSCELATMLLRKLVPMPRNSGERSFAFLFDMGEVFEKFVARLVKAIEPQARTQVRRHFGSLHLKPDIVIENRMIIDTKYKLVKNREELLAADKYQLYAYGINFGIRDTMLLYPRHLEDVKEDMMLGEGENAVKLKMRSLDLRFEGGYEEYIQEVRSRIKEAIYA